MRIGEWIGRAAALVLLLAGMSACAIEVESGKFSCAAEEPGSCPSGWICQCRGAACDWLCYESAAGYCGDGQLDPGEACDGTAFADGDVCAQGGFAVCSITCETGCTTCGDGTLESTPSGEREECDDGNAVDGDGCSAACTLARCGDGYVDPTLQEGCDDGDDNSDDADAACRTNCQPRRCGDGVIDLAAGEICDDANLAATDGCTPDCRSDETCGNGYVDFLKGELCDDGDRASQDGCASGCQPETPAWVRADFTEPAPRFYAAAAYDAGRGRIVVFGGRSNETWEWDGTRWTRRFSTVSPAPRGNHALAYDAHRGRTVLFGGYESGTMPMGDTWEWDGRAWSPHSPATRPPPSNGLALAYDARHQHVVMFGGWGGNELGHLADTWTWDGTDWRRVELDVSPPGRSYHSLAYDPQRGRVVLFGGYRYEQGQRINLADTWEWDGTRWELMAPAESPEARSAHVLAYDARRGKVILFGGGTGDVQYDAVWEWDGVTWAKAASTTPAPSTRESHVMAYDVARGEAVVFSGAHLEGGGYYDLNDTWRWNGTSWSKVLATSSPSRRFGQALAYDRHRGRTVLFGGSTVNVSQADTWEWDGAVWVQRQPAASPPRRARHGLAYDALRRKTVLFGGVVHDNGEGRLLDDTWEWDGTTWSPMTVGVRPAARYDQGMAYDLRRGRTVLFGGGHRGLDTSVTHDDTWEWDGTTWHPMQPETSPPARVSPGLAYDARRGVTVLYGGVGADFYSDTWEWDGTTWTQRSSVRSPPPAHLHSLAYDDVRGTVVAYGGTLNGRVWEWDGVNWSEVFPETTPAATEGETLVYDAQRQEILMFTNGYSDGSTYQAETWRLRYQASAATESCVHGLDGDRDGLVGCDDPDCWGFCAPTCPAETSCAPEWSHCGDATCDPSEGCRICPEDCGACPLECGDFVCDAGETAAACPGDCP